jgi:hypothetical protein
VPPLNEAASDFRRLCPRAAAGLHFFVIIPAIIIPAIIIPAIDIPGK